MKIDRVGFVTVQKKCIAIYDKFFITGIIANEVYRPGACPVIPNSECKLQAQIYSTDHCTNHSRSAVPALFGFDMGIIFALILT